jgi:hypothetical protein
MRRTAILLVLVLSCALLGACGKSDYASTAPASSSAPAATATQGATTSRRPAPTHAQALAFASAVNLTAADVPGFTATSSQHGESAAERRLAQQLRSCLGTRGSQALGSQGAVLEAGSPHFDVHRGILSVSVSSEVTVARDAAQAAGVLSAMRNPRVRACVSRYVEALLKSQRLGGATVAGVSIASGTPPAPGTTGGFGWRVTATLAYRGIRLSFYMDILGFVDGNAQVTLFSSSVLRPFPASAQEDLFSKLLSRARARAHGL